MRRARRSREGPGVARRNVLLVEWADGDGVRGGPRSMAAAILSRLEAMRLRGLSNIASRSRRALILCRIPDSSRSCMSNSVCWSCRNGWSSSLTMLPLHVVGLDLLLRLGVCTATSSAGPCALFLRPGSSSCETALHCFDLLYGCVTFISCQ